jgi:ribosomal protein L7/L12
MDNNGYLLVAILVLLVLSLFVRGGGDGDRIARLERKLDVILKQLGIDPAADVNPRVLELVRSGQKIEAIKLYRSETGVGLKEAKDYVDSL